MAELLLLNPTGAPTMAKRRHRKFSKSFHRGASRAGNMLVPLASHVIGTVAINTAVSYAVASAPDTLGKINQALKIGAGVVVAIIGSQLPPKFGRYVQDAGTGAVAFNLANYIIGQLRYAGYSKVGYAGPAQIVGQGGDPRLARFNSANLNGVNGQMGRSMGNVSMLYRGR